MPHIYRELKHYKAIRYQLLTELRSRLPLFLCICRKVKENEYAHDSVFAEAVHYISGYNNLLLSPLKHFTNEEVV